MLYFHPYLGKITMFTNIIYFSTGLKPPTSKEVQKGFAGSQLSALPDRVHQLRRPFLTVEKGMSFS